MLRDGRHHRAQRTVRNGVSAHVDHLTSGLQPGRMIVIAARPGIGRYSLARDMARVCDQSATTPVFWQAVSSQRPSSCLVITYSGAPSLLSSGLR
ncbi:DnaB-like helicase C-terminal domain-containing protein [Streptomyces mexicanus]|uniref:SF4 helicase domain-containing protein n=1 Tax=Streptomyces mexicanus TaxID=178566 RepID=A0A7X1I129_9ACTN|nr:hypothetical protein [Streptomyces mexicanus]